MKLQLGSLCSFRCPFSLFLLSQGVTRDVFFVPLTYSRGGNRHTPPYSRGGNRHPPPYSRGGNRHLELQLGSLCFFRFPFERFLVPLGASWGVFCVHLSYCGGGNRHLKVVFFSCCLHNHIDEARPSTCLSIRQQWEPYKLSTLQ